MILSMLIKEIPTFDFAIILCVATDILEQEIDTKEILEQKIEYKEGEIVKRLIRKYLMCDSVLFECGLCIMALGTDRVILLRDRNVAIPFDLTIGLEKMGVKTIEYNADNLHDKLKDVNAYIEKKSSEISPIVIGASITTADGYFNNFILRFWENIRYGFIDFETKDEFNPDVSQIRMDIYIPYKISIDLNEKIKDFYEANNYKRGIVPQGKFRGIEFRYKIVGDAYVICDYPSTLTASYNTVKDILNLSADERHDRNAEERSLMKERDSFLLALKKLMMKESLTLKLSTFQKNKSEIQEILDRMKQVNIIELEEPPTGSRYGSNPIHY
jgi:hypothetical protein